MDSFPLVLCQPVRNFQTTIFEKTADIKYNASKHLCFYGFKVHMFVTLSGYILSYIVTPASVHDIQVADELLEGCQQSAILADLGYLSKELKERLKQKYHHLWIPWRQNMDGASEHKGWRLLTLRQTIETRSFELCSRFKIEHTLTRSLSGL